MNKWIPVSERLPEEEGEYLCSYIFDNKVFIEIYGYSNNLFKTDKGEFKEYEGQGKKGFYEWNDRYECCIEGENIIAWQPLPEPYKESEEEYNKESEVGGEE